MLDLLILEFTFLSPSSLQAFSLSLVKFTQSSTVLLSSLKPNIFFIFLKTEPTIFPTKPFGSSSLATHLTPFIIALAIKLTNLKDIVTKLANAPPNPGALKVYSSFTSLVYKKAKDCARWPPSE